MTSKRNNLNAGTYNLTTFTNDFSQNFNNYLTYNETTGEITCNKTGWYYVFLDISGNHGTPSYQSTLSLIVNNVTLSYVKCRTSQYSQWDSDCDGITFFLKEGNTISFSEYVPGTMSWEMIVKVLIYKM